MRTRLLMGLTGSAALAGCASLIGLDLGGYDAKGSGGASSTTGTSSATGTTSTTGTSGTTGTGGAAGIGGAGGMDSVCGLCPEGAWCDTTYGWCVHEWANWPMPNAPGDGLPNTASYSWDTDTVTDNVTGLVWQRNMDATACGSGKCMWGDAHAYCGALDLGGHTDWRLPSVIELVSIVDYIHTNPAIDSAAFPGTPWDAFWSATPTAFEDSSAWFVTFDIGFVGIDQRFVSWWVRCVR